MHDDATTTDDDTTEKKKKKKKSTLRRVGSGIIDSLVIGASATGGLTASAVSAVVPNSGGAVDVLVVKNWSTNELRCTPFFVRFANAKSLFSKKIYSNEHTLVSFAVNGKVHERFEMKLSRNGACAFVHENCKEGEWFDGWDETAAKESQSMKHRSDEEKRKSTRDTLNETESIAIEEAEEVGSRSSGEEEEEEEEDEEEEAPKAPVSETQTPLTEDKGKVPVSSSTSSGKYTRARRWLKSKVKGIGVNHSSNSNSGSANDNKNKNNGKKKESTTRVRKPPRKRRNTRLTSEELKTLDLKPGLNTVSYSYTSRVFGTQTLECNLFLWNSDDKCVVSDIDGTITKSDVLGHIYTMVGKDYAHPGIASLYHNIVRNGYKILFVTSRAISQSNSTRAYLRTLTQNGQTLPLGPVMCAPDPISTALYREVVARKPEVFKIRCLTRVRRLFDVDINNTRMFAGFGNRSSDALAYKTCGIELDKIYTIDPKSRLRCEKNGKTFEIQNLMDNVDQAFPPIEGRTRARNEEEHVVVAARWKMEDNESDRKESHARVRCLLTAEEKSATVYCSLFVERTSGE